MATAASNASWRLEAERALREKNWSVAKEVSVARLKETRADAQAWVFLGEALEHMGDRGGAWACFDRGWMLDPPAAWAPQVMARLVGAESEPISDWLKDLLAVPTVRVMGAILAKNEAENIERCVLALKPAVDGVVVVDTGSTDGTVDIAKKAGAIVVETEWQDDFGLARQAAESALGETGWVLWVDADEFLDPQDINVPRVAAGLYESWDPPMLLRIVQVNHLGERVEPNYDTTRMFPLGKGLT
jgi:hypothetical protein